MVPNNFYYLDDPGLVADMIDMREAVEMSALVLERIADADRLLAEMGRQYLEPCQP